ncbi:MAG: hypothetical protein KKD44_11045 [Proteobacteria bacterium]|nr:hypothetical protein [Pseudomonadota bacterium]
MENQKACLRCGFDRRYEDDRRVLYNVMPLGYGKRRKKIERRAPVERRIGWARHTRWGSVGPENRVGV